MSVEKTGSRDHVAGPNIEDVLASLLRLIEHSRDASVEWYDAEGRILYCSRATEARFGWAHGSAIGKTLLDLGVLDEQEAAAFAKTREAASRGEYVAPFALRYRQSEGSLGTRLATLFRIPYADAPECVVCLGIEMSEHARTVASARTDEALRASIYGVIDDAVCYLAVESIDRYRFLSVNPAFLALVGLEENAILGKRVDELVAEPLLARILERCRETLAAKRPVRWEEALPIAGQVRHGEIIASAVQQPGETHASHLVATFRDVTERRAGEAERRELGTQLAQAERLRSLSTLVAGIAHDFGNVLGAVQANAELALLDLPESHPSRRRVDDIKRASGRASQLIRRVLTLGSDQPSRRERIDLRTTVDEVVDLVRVTLPAGVKLDWERPASGAVILGDSVQLHQVVLNLATNASFAMRGRTGHIRIELGSITVGAIPRSTDHGLPDGEYILLTLSDEGCGMTAETMSRAFDPFFTTKAKGEGTGLGLSTVHRIVRAHDGTIAIASEVDKGTTFTLRFPRAPASQSVMPAVASRTRVLYVDDEEALIMLAKRALGRLGFDVTGFTDPQVALREFIARPGEFDVLVSDVSMPMLTGHELAEQVRLVRPGFPVVLTTGFVRDEDYAVAQRLNVRIVPKPMTMEDLTTELVPMLRQRE